MQTTENLGLLKPEGAEFFNISHQNENMDKIDEEFQKKIDIPSGGSVGQVLKRTTDGAVEWDYSNGQYGVCDTPDYAADKLVQIPGFVLKSGVRVAAKFVNGNSAAGAALNVSGTGAVPIVSYGQIPCIKSGCVYSFVYDGQSWVMEGSESGGVLWSGALLEGGSIEFEVPAYYVHDGQLGLVVDSFVPGKANAKSALTTLFFGNPDGEQYLPYCTLGNPYARLRRCDVVGDEAADDRNRILEISGVRSIIPKGSRYIDTYKVRAQHLASAGSHTPSIFTRISAYVPG